MKYIMNGKDIDTLEKGGKIPLYTERGEITDVKLVVKKDHSHIYNAFGYGESIYIDLIKKTDISVVCEVVTDGVEQLFAIPVRDW